MEFDTNSPFAALIPQFDAIVEQVKNIDTLLSGLAGTHAARKADALAKLVANDAPEVTVLARATAHLERAKARHESAKNALDEAVNAALRGDKAANTTERDAHLATRETLVTSAAAMATLIAGSPKPLTATDLGISKPKGVSASGSPRTAKVGQGVFSYRRNGDSDWTVPCDAQQSLSSIAYRVFDKAPVGDLRTAMETVTGGKVDETSPFEVTVTLRDKTASIKFEVTEAPATEG